MPAVVTMMTSMSESLAAGRQFCIEGHPHLDHGRLGHFVAGGRCWKGPVPLGTVFTSIGTLRSDGTWVTTSSCELAVEAISSYGHAIDELDEGMTAQIVLVGRADRPLAARDLLTQ
jgi:hypothetical protein